MSRGNVCLVDDAIINYCSDIVYRSAPNKTYTHLRSSEEVFEDNVCCFYDGYPIDKNVVGIPKKRNRDGSFSVWGYFCSYECARSFVSENNTFCNQDKEFSLLALMGIKTYGVKFRLLKAPNKFLLKKFGGPLDIDSWRNENHSSRLWVLHAPNTERTCLTYDCFLNIESSATINQNKGKKESNKEDKQNNFHLDKRVTPAHFTKKSLLSLVKKTN